MELRSTTKMAYQAALSIAIAEFIGVYFFVERSYWITLTAMALTTQTWGESVKRSLERVGMTILGGAVGTALYFYLPENRPDVLLGLILFFVFFTVYMAKIQYLISVFFLTCYVVFLFAMLGEWNLRLLSLRIIDTAVGALIAVIVGFFFFSLKTNVENVFIDFLQKTKAVLIASFTTVHVSPNVIDGRELLTDFQLIKKKAISIRYELLFHRLSGVDFNRLLNKFMFCAEVVVNLTEAYQWLSSHLTEEEKEIVVLAVDTTVHNLQVIIQRLEGENDKELLSEANFSGLLTKAIAEDPNRFASLESDALGFFSLIYFFSRLNVQLKEVCEIISKAY